MLIKRILFYSRKVNYYRHYYNLKQIIWQRKNRVYAGLTDFWIDATVKLPCFPLSLPLYWWLFLNWIYHFFYFFNTSCKEYWILLYFYKYKCIYLYTMHLFLLFWYETHFKFTIPVFIFIFLFIHFFFPFHLLFKNWQRIIWL